MTKNSEINNNLEEFEESETDNNTECDEMDNDTECEYSDNYIIKAIATIVYYRHKYEYDIDVPYYIVKDQLSTYYDVYLTDEELDEIVERSGCFKSKYKHFINAYDLPMLYNIRTALSDFGENLSNKAGDLADDFIYYSPTILLVSVAATVGGTLLLCHHVAKENEKYHNSTLVIDDEEYQMSDIYTVYNADEIHYCTRKIVSVNERTAVDVDGEPYSYREDKYAYYDIITGEKICEDHENGYYYEPMLEVLKQDEMKSYDYAMTYDEAEETVTLDRVLSREPSHTRVG